MNLLYIQAVAEINWGWISITDELRNKLTVLKKHGKKKEVYLSIYIHTSNVINYMKKLSITNIKFKCYYFSI